METALSVALGIGLAAAVGFRVFVPLLIISLAGYFGYLELGDGFAWMTGMPAIITFGVATVLEVAAYYVPWLDNFLDTIATPMAVVAGAITAASVMVDLPPLLKWMIAIIGGGGAAGLLQGATALLRFKSTALTSGFANPVIATGEVILAVVVATLALFLPLVCLVLCILAVVGAFRLAGHILFGRQKQAAAPVIAPTPSELVHKRVRLTSQDERAARRL